MFPSKNHVASHNWLSNCMAILATCLFTLNTAPASAAANFRAQGEVILVAFNYCPSGFTPANGSSQATYTLQYSNAVSAHFASKYGTYGSELQLPSLNNAQYGQPSKLPLDTMQYCVATNGSVQQESQSSGQPYVGEVKLFATDFCPQGWFAANGQSAPLNRFQLLYALTSLQTPPRTQGGEPLFNLPDLSTKSPVSGMQYCIAWDGEYPQRP